MKLLAVLFVTTLSSIAFAMPANFMCSGDVQNPYTGQKNDRMVIVVRGYPGPVNCTGSNCSTKVAGSFTYTGPIAATQPPRTYIQTGAKDFLAVAANGDVTVVIGKETFKLTFSTATDVEAGPRVTYIDAQGTQIVMDEEYEGCEEL